MFTKQEAPQHLVTQLQEIDPDADLIWIGSGWMLCVRQDNPAAKQKALQVAERINKKQLATKEDRFRLLWYGWLANQGVRPIKLFEPDECDERIVKDFRERDYNWRNRAEETVAENIELSTDEARREQNQQLVRDVIHAEKKSLHRIIAGNPSVPSAGVPKEND